MKNPGPNHPANRGLDRRTEGQFKAPKESRSFKKDADYAMNIVNNPKKNESILYKASKLIGLGDPEI